MWYQEYLLLYIQHQCQMINVLHRDLSNMFPFLTRLFLTDAGSLFDYVFFFFLNPS